MPTGRLNTRLVRLESIRAGGEPVALALTPEQRGIAQRIVDRWYADPVRHARQIALIESIERRRRQQVTADE